MSDTGRGSHSRLLLPMATLAVLAVLGGVFIWRTSLPAETGHPDGGGTATATPTPTVPVARLDAVVLSPAEVSTILADPGLQADPLKRVMDEPTYMLSNPECFSALRAVVAPAYQGSDWSAVRSQYFGDPGTSVDHEARQGVVAFPSAEKADAFLQGAAARWNDCVGQTVTAAALDGSATQRVTFENVSGTAPKVTLTSSVDAPAGRVCQRALSAVANVVIDVGVCGHDVTDEASRITAQIAANVNRII